MTILHNIRNMDLLIKTYTLGSSANNLNNMYQEEITWNLLGNVAHFILTEKHSLYSANSSLVNSLLKIKTTKTLF